MKKKGFLMVISGPSGVGKGTVCQALLKDNDKIKYSISATTRPKRPQERSGDDYFFLSEEEFEKGIKEDKFLEYARVHGNLYGTPKDFVMDGINNGEVIILEIDVQGALQVKENYPNGVFIFLLPPSMSELERRLTHRGTESAEQVELRLNNARGEISKISEYQYAVINDTVENAVAHINSIIDAESLRVINNLSLDEYLKEETYD